MTQVKTKQIDTLLLGAVLILLILGMLSVYSASSFRGAEKYGDPNQFIKLHMVRVGLGLFCLLVATRIDYHALRWIMPVVFLLVFGLLFVVLAGPKYNGSRRSILFLGNQFQPSEMMKLALVFYIAAAFAKGKEAYAIKGKGLIVHYVILLAVVGLVFIEPDLGSALVLFFMGYSLLFLAGVSWKSLIQMGLAVIPLITLGMAVFPYQRQRFLDYLGSVFGSEPMSYQVRQSIIGLAHGGLTGVGYGGGKQKLFFLPEPFSDFVLASLGEEMGFIGVAFLFILLAVVLWRGVHIALEAPDRYGYLVACGVTVMVLVNALINAGVVLNLIPTTGLPFPFLSYGGTSLFVNLTGVGILLNISRKRRLNLREFTTWRSKRSLDRMV